MTGKKIEKSLGVLRVWALAAGGMVGGGIYIALGVVISASGQWAWLSFFLSGLIACITAYSYAFLSNKFEKSGGAFEFLEEVHYEKLAGTLSWLLIVGYILTISVYLYAFGHYLAYAFGGGEFLIRVVGIIAGILLILLNLMGLGKMTFVEVIIVTGNLGILLLLAFWGIGHWDLLQLTSGIEPRPPWTALIGAAAIFVSYEGFQLLTYEYEAIKNAKKTFVPVLVSAAIFVVFCYVLVTIGATMLSGALTLVEQKEIALSVIAKQSFGQTGLIVMTFAAVCATSAAINSTLFSTGKLAVRISENKELPSWVAHKNAQDVPDRPIILIGVTAIILATLGSLSTLVEAASLIFIVTFIVVNFIAAKEMPHWKCIPWLAILLSLVLGLVLLGRLAVIAPVALGGLSLIVVLITLGRPYLLSHLAEKDQTSKDMLRGKENE